VQRLARAGIIDHILSTDHELAVGLFAQRARILMLHADRGPALLRQAGLIEDQNAVGRATLDQQAHPLLIEGQRVPAYKYRFFRKER